MYEISLKNAPLFIWGGLFTKENQDSWQHKPMETSENFQVLIGRTQEMQLVINGQQFVLAPGVCLVIPPNSLIESSQKVLANLSFYWFHFLASWQTDHLKSQQLAQDLSQIEAKQATSHVNNWVLLPATFTLQQPARIFLKLTELLSNDSHYVYSQRIRDFQISELLILLSNDYLNQLVTKKNATKKTTPIAEWIRVNLAKELTLVKIAEHFQLNPNYLSRLFKKEQGLTIKEYLLETKFQQARYLLATTDLSINEVAEAAFFGDSKHFMRIFKEKHQVSPTTYRRQLQGTRLNSDKVDPSAPLPDQFGTQALHQLIKGIMTKNQPTD